MDRPVPTDPPDEPVNRIKQFFSTATPSFSKGTVYFSPSGTPLPEEERRKVEQELLQLSLDYEKDVKDRHVVLQIATAYMKLEDFAAARQWLEYLIQIDPSQQSVVQHLKKLLEEMGESNPPPQN